MKEITPSPAGFILSVPSCPGMGIGEPRALVSGPIPHPPCSLGLRGPGLWQVSVPGVPVLIKGCLLPWGQGEGCVVAGVTGAGRGCRPCGCIPGAPGFPGAVRPCPVPRVNPGVIHPPPELSQPWFCSPENAATKRSFLVCVCWECQRDDGFAWKGK